MVVFCAVQDGTLARVAGLAPPSAARPVCPRPAPRPRAVVGVVARLAWPSEAMPYASPYACSKRAYACACTDFYAVVSA